MVTVAVQLVGPPLILTLFVKVILLLLKTTVGLWILEGATMDRVTTSPDFARVFTALFEEIATVVSAGAVSSRIMEAEGVPSVELPAASVVTARKRIYLSSATRAVNCSSVNVFVILVPCCPLVMLCVSTAATFVQFETFDENPASSAV